MIADSERREAAARLRKTRVERYNSILNGIHLGEIVGVGAQIVSPHEDQVRAAADRLADLIEPGEPKVKCVAEVKIDGERLEQLVHDAAVELTGIDRDALLALADGLEADANRIIKAAKNAQFGGGPRMSEAKHDADEWRSIARRIRAALGEVE